MRSLDLISILCTALMVGNELCVSLFINPVMRRLGQQPQALALSLFAKSLGKTMPFWYALGLLLIATEAVLRRHEPAMLPLTVAAVLWAIVIVFTVVVLVPINNRIAALTPATAATGWQQEHRKWDALHRLRIAALAVAVVCLTWALLGAR